MTRPLARLAPLVALAITCSASSARADDGVRPWGVAVAAPAGPNGEFTIAGLITPFGVLVGDGVITLDPVDPLRFTAVADLEGPDGSRLSVTTVGTFTPDFSGYTETITFRSGTGRFARASGTAEVVASISPTGQQVIVVTGGRVRLR